MFRVVQIVQSVHFRRQFRVSDKLVGDAALLAVQDVEEHRLDRCYGLDIVLLRGMEIAEDGPQLRRGLGRRFLRIGLANPTWAGDNTVAEYGKQMEFCVWLSLRGRLPRFQITSVTGLGALFVGQRIGMMRQPELLAG
ncbi:hypothetical protein BIW11_04435 [Tropilaelaps mercedesae]|uniref:Uncharacterized protein n=1 Tax=Tropilaelaps mercedesae TaxID=418985 RepID=A0A1V9X691_9ACAR|nr:hypothetical protein BIW11_04435 [Tropilaelaps mercedesae]